MRVIEGRRRGSLGIEWRPPVEDESIRMAWSVKIGERFEIEGHGWRPTYITAPWTKGRVWQGVWVNGEGNIFEPPHDLNTPSAELPRWMDHDSCTLPLPRLIARYVWQAIRGQTHEGAGLDAVTGR